MSSVYDISGIRGSDLSLSFVARDTNGSAINLSGYSVSGSVKYRYSSTGALLMLAPTIDTSYVSGIINLFISGNSLTGLPICQARYDIDIYGPTGHKCQVTAGLFNIAPSIT